MDAPDKQRVVATRLVSRPTPGFYRYFLHDPNDLLGNHTYEVLGVGHHNEDATVFCVVMRPLFSCFAYRLGKLFEFEPLETFVNCVLIDGNIVDCYTLVTDTEMIAKLEKLRAQMYP